MTAGRAGVDASNAGRVGLLVSAVVSAVGTFLPFARSGERSRSSYELVALARRLDLVPEAWPDLLTRLWFAVPLLLAACWLLVLAGRAVPGAGCALTVSLLALGALVAVARSPLALGPGWALTAVGAAGLASSAAVVLGTELGARRRGGR